MNFSECVTIVLDLVKRPDKLTAAEMAVNSALSKAILKGEYPQDLVETSIPIDSSLYAQTIDLTAISPPLTRFRKWKYVKQPGASNRIMGVRKRGLSFVLKRETAQTYG